MGLWNRESCRLDAHEVENFAFSPSGGPVKRWIGGGAIAGGVIWYAIVCLRRGRTCFIFGGQPVSLEGTEGLALAVAYLAIGGFIHFHYFWGLSDRLERFSELGKVVSLIFFLVAYFYAMFEWVVMSNSY